MNQSFDQATILLTNDDGIYADGLWVLYQKLSARYKLQVVAPDRERSAVGHGITLHNPLRVDQVTVNGGYQGWAVNGTPADCIKLALVELMQKRPALVISGINPGANVGVNLNYSGTVAAAKEAALYGIASVAVSIQHAGTLQYETAVAYMAELIPKILGRGLPRGTFLNVNVPNVPMDQIAGVRLSRQGNELYDEFFEKRSDPRNRIYYWQGSESQPRYAHGDADGALLAANFISITPVQCDMTDFHAMEALKSWRLEGEVVGRAETQ